MIKHTSDLFFRFFFGFFYQALLFLHGRHEFGLLVLVFFIAHRDGRFRSFFNTSTIWREWGRFVHAYPNITWLGWLVHDLGSYGFEDLERFGHFIDFSSVLALWNFRWCRSASLRILTRFWFWWLHVWRVFFLLMINIQLNLKCYIFTLVVSFLSQVFEPVLYHSSLELLAFLCSCSCMRTRSATEFLHLSSWMWLIS